jgi:hypothetical protein
MKKLTYDRLVAVKAAIWKAQVSAEQRKTENPATTSERWYELMKIYWHSEGVIMDELSCSMSQAISLIQGKTVLSDYYDMATGRPKAAK